jgi:phytoene dehydrogenase-like protein
MSHDVIVVGAGHNGLTTAALLGKAGRNVLVLERRGVPGGLAAREEFHPGYSAPGLLHDSGHVRAGVVAALGLVRHGLVLHEASPDVLISRTGEAGLVLSSDERAMVEALGAVSDRDAEAWPRWCAQLSRWRRLISRLADNPPPDVEGTGVSALVSVISPALALRRLGRRGMAELLHVLPMCAADWLNEWFETPALKAALAGPAVAGTWTGPWSAGSAMQLLWQSCTEGRHVVGGASTVTAALLAAAKEADVELRTEAEVTRVEVQDGKVTGVTLASGENLPARTVVASCDPSRALLGLIAKRHLPTTLESHIRNWRMRGTTAKLHLALDALPEWVAAPGQRVRRARLVGDLDDLERAFDAVKYGRASSEPYLDVALPSLEDPSLAPEGKAVMSVLVSFAPYHLEGGWNDVRREELADTVLATLERHAPGLKRRVLAREMLSPADIEQRYGATGGHVHHGEHALDQWLHARPELDCSRYETPISGLYLCGSGSHPGGGLSCAPGWLAARAIAGPSAGR